MAQEARIGNVHIDFAAVRLGARQADGMVPIITGENAPQLIVEHVLDQLNDGGFVAGYSQVKSGTETGTRSTHPTARVCLRSAFSMETLSNEIKRALPPNLEVVAHDAGDDTFINIVYTDTLRYAPR